MQLRSLAISTTALLILISGQICYAQENTCSGLSESDECVVLRLTKSISDCKSREVCYRPGRDYETRAQAYYRLGKIDLAYKDIFRAIKEEEFIGGLTIAYLGHIYFDKGKYEKAVQQYNIAITRQNGRAEGYLGLGNLYRLQRDFSQAVESYEKAIFYNANLSKAHYNLGLTYSEMAKSCDAEKCTKSMREDLINSAIKEFDVTESIDLVRTSADVFFQRWKAYEVLGNEIKAQIDKRKYEALAASQNP